MCMFDTPDVPEVKDAPPPAPEPPKLISEDTRLAREKQRRQNQLRAGLAGTNKTNGGLGGPSNTTGGKKLFGQ